MASTIKRTTKTGDIFYEIQVSRGRGKAKLSTRWYPPDGWGKRAIDKELAKVAAEFERKVDAGEIVSRAEKQEAELAETREAAKVLTLRQYGETVFMPAKTVTMSENARSSYQGNLDHWIYPALGDLKMPDVTTANVSALLLSMQTQGKAQSTCVKTYTVLSGLFKMAYLNDDIPRNPMDKVQRPKPRKEEVKAGEVEAYTVDDILHILSCLEGEPLKWRVYLCLSIDTGLRRGEVCGLRWKDVNYKDNTITITGNLCYTPQKGVYLDTPKSRRFRTVDVDPSVMRLLRQLQIQQASECVSPYVFTQENSTEPMHPQSPGRYMQKFAARCGIEHLHPHKLRHSFASIAITSGADIASISEKLGHADKSTTLRLYTHADQESMRRASQVFRDALKKKSKPKKA